MLYFITPEQHNHQGLLISNYYKLLLNKTHPDRKPSLDSPLSFLPFWNTHTLPHPSLDTTFIVCCQNGKVRRGIILAASIQDDLYRDQPSCGDTDLNNLCVSSPHMEGHGFILTGSKTTHPQRNLDGLIYELLEGIQFYGLTHNIKEIIMTAEYGFFESLKSCGWDYKVIHDKQKNHLHPEGIKASLKISSQLAHFFSKQRVLIQEILPY